MNLESCRVCGGRFISKLERQGHRYGRCEQCGSLIKIMSQDDYRAIDVTYDPGELLLSSDAARLKEELQIDTRRAFLSAILERNGTKPDAGPLRLLDIGCGMGAFLLAGRDLGLDVQGVEPSESHSRIGRDFFKLPIKTAYFDRRDFEARSFDIVILSHVIEHLYDPKQMLADLAEIVRPGGVIMVMTPNAESSIALVSGAAWSMLAPVDHVTMLSPRAALSLTPPGFDVSTWTSEFSWEPMVGLLQTARARWRRGSVPTSIPQGDSTSNSFRRTPTKIQGNRLLQAALSLVSAPLWLYNKISGRGACLVAQYRRKSAEA